MEDWKIKIQEQLKEAIQQRAIKPVVAEQVREGLKQKREFCMIYSAGRQQYMGIMYIKQGEELLAERIRGGLYNFEKLADYSGLSDKHVRQYILKIYGIEGWRLFKENQ